MFEDKNKEPVLLVDKANVFNSVQSRSIQCVKGHWWRTVENNVITWTKIQIIKNIYEIHRYTYNSAP